MSIQESSLPICKYCLEALHNEFEKFHEAHADCSKEFSSCESSSKSFLDQIHKSLPKHTLKLFLEPKINLKTLGMFSHSQLEHMQKKISSIVSTGSPDEPCIIILFHSSNVAYIYINQLDLFPGELFDLASLLYLQVIFTPAFTGMDSFSLANFQNLLCLDLTLQSNIKFPTITYGGKHEKLKFLRLVQPSTNSNTHVPDGIESCSELETLLLHIPIDEYPTSLCYLSKLQSLRIEGSRKNWKLIIPNTIVNLTSLHTLEIISEIRQDQVSQNESDEILENINSVEVTNVTVEDRLLNLETFFLQGFALGYDEFFPIVLGKKMHNLTITICDLDEISEEFIIFENLKELNLNNNRINIIPSFFRRTGVKTVHISNNKLTDITNLNNRKIEFIDVSNNLLESVPEKLMAKKKLQINLEGNKL